MAKPTPVRSCHDQSLEWDAAELKVTNSADANALLSRRYRDGWQVPPLG